MRRKDAEVTGRDIIDIIARYDVCRLGMTDGMTPYVVPLNYGYTHEGGRLTLYFHGAKEGRKLELLKKNPRVCFEIDGAHKLIPGETPCKYSFDCESVIGTGEAQFITDAGEAAHALDVIMQRFGGVGDYRFTEQDLARVAVFKVNVEELSGKRKRKQV